MEDFIINNNKNNRDEGPEGSRSFDETRDDAEPRLNNGNGSKASTAPGGRAEPNEKASNGNGNGNGNRNKSRSGRMVVTPDEYKDVERSRKKNLEYKKSFEELMEMAGASDGDEFRAQLADWSGRQRAEFEKKLGKACKRFTKMSRHLSESEIRALGPLYERMCGVADNPDELKRTKVQKELDPFIMLINLKASEMKGRGKNPGRGGGGGGATQGRGGARDDDDNDDDDSLSDGSPVAGRNGAPPGVNRTGDDNNNSRNRRTGTKNVASEPPKRSYLEELLSSRRKSDNNNNNNDDDENVDRRRTRKGKEVDRSYGRRGDDREDYDGDGRVNNSSKRSDGHDDRSDDDHSDSDDGHGQLAHARVSKKRAAERKTAHHDKGVRFGEDRVNIEEAEDRRMRKKAKLEEEARRRGFDPAHSSSSRLVHTVASRSAGRSGSGRSGLDDMYRGFKPLNSNMDDYGYGGKNVAPLSFHHSMPTSSPLYRRIMETPRNGSMNSLAVEEELD